MKPLPLFFLLLVILLVTLAAEDLLPALIFLGQAHLVLFPIIFCFAVIVLPFMGALFFGMMTGLLEGLMVMHIQHGHVEIRIGWFIFFFMLWALALQLLSDLTHGIRWELHALASGLCTATFILGEFLLLTFSRGNFFVTNDLLLLSCVPAGIAVLLAPLVYGLLEFLISPPRQASTNYLFPL
ncbi:MAG: hypothetical protein ACOYK6_01430 [Chthoniobacterales bacterium]